MKKIVGILAAAALIATSVFAADVSANVRIAGDIFAYDGTAIDGKEGKAAGSFSMLRAATQSRVYWSPYITLSTSTDEAGAEVKFCTGDDDGATNIVIDRSNVWFKPLDMLTIKAGFQGYNMHQEDIDYSNPTGAETWGYGISYAQDAITVNLFLATGNNGWFFQDGIAKYGTSKNDATSVSGTYINDLYLNAAYAADFGTITAMFEYKGKQITADSANANTVRFGAGYGNTIDALTFWADVVGTSYGALSKDEITVGTANAAKAALKAAQKVNADIELSSGNLAWKSTHTAAATDAGEMAEAQIAYNNALESYASGCYTDYDTGDGRSAFGLFVDGYVKYEQDALKLRGYFDVNVKDFGHKTKGDDGKYKADIMADNNFELGLKAQVDYKLDNGINLFAYFGDNNLLRKEFKNGTTEAKLWKNYSSVFVSTIKAGAEGNVGACTIKTWLEFNTGANVEYKAGVDADTWGKYDKVKIAMPVWLTVAF